jgi:ribosome maturation factor RimP
LRDLYDKERSLYREVASWVERSLPAVEVLAVELSGPERFTVFVDHPQGVDHALCRRVTDVLDPFRRTYGIDVSSPGSERPLRKPEHFRSVVGKRAAVRTSQEIGGRKRFRGEIVDADERSVRLAAEAADEPIEIPYDSIVRGNLIATPESR